MIVVRDPARRRTATLIVRAWVEPDGEIRARLLTVGRGGASTTWATARGVSAVVEAVRSWSLALRACGPDDHA